jgi:hypothetical protein
MARGNESSSSSSESDSDENDDEAASYDELKKQVQFFNEVCIKQRKQISELKNKYTKTKIKNYDNATDKELMIIIDNLKSKASSQDVHENLLIKMKLLEEQNNEVASKLKAIGSTPEAPKIDESNEIIKKDASTSCNDLCDLDSPFCNQVCFEKIVVETCTQEVAMENE